MNTFDVLIVGGGAAGLSAALVLSRARRTVAVVDSGAPRNAPAAHMHGYLSRDGMPPSDLLKTGRAEVTGYGGTIIAGRVDELVRRRRDLPRGAGRRSTGPSEARARHHRAEGRAARRPRSA